MASPARVVRRRNASDPRARQNLQMQAGDIKLGKLFANDHQHVIPLFQRPYVWTEEANWLPLWTDIRRSAEDVEAEQAALEPEGDPPTYFLGAVVVQDRRRAPKRLSSSHIIDGQQRLTTLQILIAAARQAASDGGHDAVAARFTSLLENRFEVVDEDYPDDRLKVWPLPQDRPAFLWSTGRAEDRGEPPDAEHLLVRARDWFETTIQDWAVDGDRVAHRLDCLYFALQDRIQMVQITLDASDDPQVIFEALNHRGVRLAATDLIKNLLFQNVDRQGDARRAEKLLTDHWLALDGKYWRGEVTTGRIRRVRADLLLSYWLAVQTGQEVLVDHLFNEFKNWIAGTTRSAASIIEDIRHHADTYERLTALPVIDPTGRLIDAMSATRTTTPWPILLYLNTHPEIPVEQRSVGAASIDSFLMRRGVSALTSSDYNRLFALVLATLLRSDPSTAGETLTMTLLEQTADSRRWPDDEEFFAALQAPGLYDRMYRAQLKALLVGIENRLRRTGLTEFEPTVRADEGSLNIEHVLPQGWRANWPLATDGPDAELRREDAIHRLGNLTLISGRLNSKMSNKPWPEKKEYLRQRSLLLLTTQSILSDPYGSDDGAHFTWAAAWDEIHVGIRGSWLATKALGQWSRPAGVSP